VADRNPKKK